jgi:peptide deformylase
MAILPILAYPDPILQKKSQEIKDPLDPEIQGLILDMLETMKNCESAVGLAAPQVGKSLQLTTIKLNGKTYILINPKIKSKSWKKTVKEEGCLSFPGKFILVKRSKSVKVVAKNEKGEDVVLKGEDMLARVLQHEIDHLNGILYIKNEVKPKKTKSK